MDGNASLDATQAEKAVDKTQFCELVQEPREKGNE